MSLGVLDPLEGAFEDTLEDTFVDALESTFDGTLSALEDPWDSFGVLAETLTAGGIGFAW